MSGRNKSCKAHSQWHFPQAPAEPEMPSGLSEPRQPAPAQCLVEQSWSRTRHNRPLGPETLIQNLTWSNIAVCFIVVPEKIFLYNISKQFILFTWHIILPYGMFLWSRVTYYNILWCQKKSFYLTFQNNLSSSCDTSFYLK